MLNTAFLKYIQIVTAALFLMCTCTAALAVNNRPVPEDESADKEDKHRLPQSWRR